MVWLESDLEITRPDIDGVDSRTAEQAEGGKVVGVDPSLVTAGEKEEVTSN